MITGIMFLLMECNVIDTNYDIVILLTILVFESLEIGISFVTGMTWD